MRVKGTILRKPFVSLSVLALVVALGAGAGVGGSMAHGADPEAEAARAAPSTGFVATDEERPLGSETDVASNEGDGTARASDVWPSSQSAGMMAKLFMMATVAGAGPMSGAALMFR